LLTDFKESAFLADKYFRQTGRKKQAFPNISTNNLNLPAVLRRRFKKLVRSLEKVSTMFQQKHCEDFFKTSKRLTEDIEKKNLTVRRQPEKPL
jgi:spore coat protein CotF